MRFVKGFATPPQIALKCSLLLMMILDLSIHVED